MYALILEVQNWFFIFKQYNVFSWPHVFIGFFRKFSIYRVLIWLIHTVLTWAQTTE